MAIIEALEKPLLSKKLYLSAFGLLAVILLMALHGGYLEAFDRGAVTVTILIGLCALAILIVTGVVQSVRSAMTKWHYKTARRYSKAASGDAIQKLNRSAMC